MRLAFIYPPRLVGGRPIDFGNVWNSPRGLTGSETNLLASAKELVGLGHEVVLFIEAPNAHSWDGVDLCDLAELPRTASAFDAVIVGFDVDWLREVSQPGPLRVVIQQCNDFAFAKPDFRDFVDAYVLPSHAHVKSQTDPAIRPELARLGGYLEPEKCEVQPNGCYLEAYDRLEVAREAGRCVWMQSPDRGLHLVAQEWLPIKRAVPHAELRVFYYSLDSYRSQYRGADVKQVGDPVWRDFAKRAQYIDDALTKLAPFGVKAIGPISKDQLARELKEAELLLYPCDPVQWTESFGCSVLEGCASGALPVISDVDAFGEIFGGYCPMVKSPARNHMAEWTSLVISRLKNKGLADMERAKARKLAERLTWKNAGMVLEGILERRLAAR
jgi:glycosyltransferase involved in cell wall biosynthesis